MWFAWALLSLKREQVPDLDPERTGKLLQSSHRRRIHTPLDQTDKILRAADFFRKFDLRQFPCFSQGSDALAKFLLNHENGISRKGADGNRAKLRVGLSMDCSARRLDEW